MLQLGDRNRNMISPILTPLVTAAPDTSLVTELNGSVVLVETFAPNQPDSTTTVGQTDNAINTSAVVELSAEAQALAQGSTVLQVQSQEMINTEVLQQAVQQGSILSPVLEQLLSEGSSGNETVLTSPDIALTQNLDSIAVQSALADAALSEAIASTALSAVPASVSPVPPVPVIPINASLNAITATVEPAPTSPTTVLSSTQNGETTAPTVANAVPVNFATPSPVTPTIALTDPTIAAAIAAYELGEGLYTDKVDTEEESPDELNLEVEPISALQSSSLDLHDSARDHATQGITWNWVRINPILNGFAKRKTHK